MCMRVCVCVIITTGRDPVLHRSERQVKERGCSFSHQVTHRRQACGHTSAVQSGPESSESEISEYSDDRFLSSDFTLVKNPEEEERKSRS